MNFDKCPYKPQTREERLAEIDREIAHLRPILDEAIDSGEPYTGGLHYVMGRLLTERKDILNVT